MHISKIILIFVICFFCACMSLPKAYRPTATYAENDLSTISDDEIRQAFAAQPRILLPAKIAWYNLGLDRFMEDKLYTTHPNIAVNYTIPKTLVEGYSPYPAGTYNFRYSNEPLIKLNLKALRLLAARAHCDLLILVAARFSEERMLNWLAGFNLLLFPSLFSPYFDAKYAFETEVFLFDVRTGYMYNHINYPAEEKKSYLTIYDLDKVKLEVENRIQEDAAKFINGELFALFETGVPQIGAQ